MSRVYKEKACEYCGAPHRKRGRTCSRECSIKMRQESKLKIVLHCELCGESFSNAKGAGRYCLNDHFKNCEVCGEEFLLPRGKEASSRACGYSCGAILSHRSEGNREKRRENSLKKWGVEHPFQAEEVKKKVAKGIAGTAGRFGTPASEQAMVNSLGVSNASKLPEVKRKKAETFKKNFTDKGIYPKYGPISKVNLRWKKLLEEATGLEWQLEKHFTGVGSIDLYAENNGAVAAVEINPTATHNSHRNLVACSIKNCAEEKCDQHATPRRAHYEKARKLHEDFGISLTSVFDWMDEEKVVNFLRSRLKLDSNKIYARNCEVREITQREANRFFKEFHFLGPSRLQKHCYGLFYDGILVQAQSYAPLKRRGEWEARRLATRPDWVVVGGVSRLTKRFIKDVNPEVIVAYSDLNLSWPSFDREFNGFVSEEVLPPQKIWSKGSKKVLAKSAAYQSADRLIGIAKDSKSSKYPEEWSNDEVFLAEGWLPVWDAGMLKDVWRRDS